MIIAAASGQDISVWGFLGMVGIMIIFLGFLLIMVFGDEIGMILRAYARRISEKGTKQ